MQEASQCCYYLSVKLGKVDVMDALIEIIKKHEGLRLYPYQDSLGFWTIGYGRCIEKNGITPQEAEIMLRRDVGEAIARYEDLPDEVRQNCNGERQAILVEMIFQLGYLGVLKFRRMLGAIAAGDYERASKEMLMSRWASKTPSRCREKSEVMKKGIRIG